jgi:hypothetical protein
MTIETEVAALTTSTTALVTAVGLQQITVDAQVAAFAAVTNKVNTELNLVDNTADADKPISAATQTALDLKQVSLVSGVTLSTVNGLSLLTGVPLLIERGATEISACAYEDRAVLKTLTTSIVNDSVVVEGIGLFQFVTTELEPEDDETCFTVPGVGQWLLAVPAFDLISAYRLFEDAIRDEWDEDENIRLNSYLKTLGVI